jgi:hypothetical protein
MPRLSSRTTYSSIFCVTCGAGRTMWNLESYSCLQKEVLLRGVWALTHQRRNVFTEINESEALMSCSGISFQIASEAQSRELSSVLRAYVALQNDNRVPFSSRVRELLLKLRCVILYRNGAQLTNENDPFSGQTRAASLLVSLAIELHGACSMGR